MQLLGPWYVLAVASWEKSFAVEKDMKNVVGMVVTLTPENNLRMLSSQQGLEGCSQSVTELLKRNSGWVFENPSMGVLEFRVLGTNFRDYAIIFTQLEFGDEPFNTVQLYMPRVGATWETGDWAVGGHMQAKLPHLEAGCTGGGLGRAGASIPWQVASSQAPPRPLLGPSLAPPWLSKVAFPCTALAPPGRRETASQEAMGLFTKWSRGLGFPSWQQAQLQKDCECPAEEPQGRLGARSGAHRA
ncbi:hypothetical protein P7K49_002112 [Saguinus oedipus]|uniref:Lipocalin/cytosolic fatty-acid binding domain-containing protein n=1 Tax=Saguinus oedipus TaxID=9490 RepID=A0ABQ9WHC7_SAGOE|nr:hypothetical protein P7K49_002112 [Saguinus oedipus]